ncbi:hypothetical protein BGZ57DRAFT_538606 [Hyaloscypha finlandica]|nr:hypothetical protein BGZ57DRAFT_538606 [Hyaloscypha finlandica]
MAAKLSIRKIKAKLIKPSATSLQTFERVCLSCDIFGGTTEAIRVTMNDQKPTVVVEPTSSIRVNHRDYHILDVATQTLLKPFASPIPKPPQITYKGSLRLSPHKTAEKVCRVEETLVDETRIFTLLSNSSEGEKQRPVVPHKFYCFAGGGFHGPANKEHWAPSAELCSKPPQYEINLVSYPLVPVSPDLQKFPIWTMYTKPLHKRRESKIFVCHSWVTPLVKILRWSWTFTPYAASDHFERRPRVRRRTFIQWRAFSSYVPPRTSETTTRK